MSNGVFDGDGDWGVAWIDHILRGKPLPDVFAHNVLQLDTFAYGLKQALSVYSLAMLIFAAMILFYYLVVLIVETAHSGIPFGKRMSPIWAPIRLVVAIGLLMPVGTGLSSGQYIVIKIAESGSHMASSAWRAVLENSGEGFAGLVTPHAPPLGSLIATATEMEMCRLIYEQVYTPVQNENVTHLAGHINDFTKIPPGQLTDETWRYTNVLNANAPLCGEYRFAGYRPRTALGVKDSDDTARIAAEISAFSRTQTASIIDAAKSMALRDATNALSSSAPQDMDIGNGFEATEKALRTDYDNEVMKIGSNTLTAPVLSQSSQGGWIAAAFFIPEMARLQQSYGDMATAALPTVQEPIFAHPEITQQLLSDTLRYQLMPQGVEPTDIAKLVALYNHVSHAVATAHHWVSGNPLADNNFVQASSFDLRDEINTGTPPEATMSLFARALDAAAIAQGVWGVPEGNGDSGYPFTTLSSGTSYNPLATISEFGRRQYQMGVYLIGLAGQAITQPNAAAPAAFAGIVGGCFILGAMALIFLLPFLVFFRFMVGVIAWVLTLLEAIIAMPIVALAHLTPTGDGLSGSMARQSYLLWLSLWARPILTLLGLIVGFLAFIFALSFLCFAMSPLAQMSYSGNSGLLITTNVSVVLLFDVLVFALANVAFKGIYLFPSQALQWVSHFVMSDSGTISDRPASNPLAPTSGSPQSFVMRGVNEFFGSYRTLSSSRGGQGGNNGDKGSEPNKALLQALIPADMSPRVSPTLKDGAITSSTASSSATSAAQKPSPQQKPDKGRLDPHKNDAFIKGIKDIDPPGKE